MPGNPNTPKSLRAGEIFFFHQKRQLKAAYVQAMEKEKLTGETQDHRTVRIPMDLVVYATGVHVEKGAADLRAFYDSAVEHSHGIDLREVWEAFQDESALSFGDILILYTGGEGDPIQHTALLLHLHTECPYFEHKGEGYAPRSYEDIQRRQERSRQQEAQKQEESRFLEWLRSDAPPDTLTGKSSSWFKGIREYALFGEEATGSQRSKVFLGQSAEGSKRDLQRVAFDILVRKGVWDEDELLDLIRYQVPVSFPDDVMEETTRLQLGDLLRPSDRTDLTERPVFSIDDEATSDVDDAISLEWTSNGVLLGVHITDVATFVPPKSCIDRTAQQRMVSIYLPEQKISMLPPRFSENLGSLLPNERRLALSILFDLDATFAVRTVNMIPSVVINRYKFSYEEVDKVLAGGDHPLSEHLHGLQRIAEVYRTNRIAAGAIEFEREEIKIHLNAQKNIHIQTRTRQSPSNRIVTEVMILMNHYLAKYCDAHGIPAIYRTQEQSELRKVDEFTHKAVRYHHLLRQLRPSILSLEPGPHQLLGVDRYTQATSPLRRYTDLLMQRQIVHHVTRGEILYDHEAIAPILYQATERLREIGGLERRRIRYWVLKYLAQRVDEIFSVVVLERRGREALVEFMDFPFQTSIYTGAEVNPDDVLQVQLARVDPWANEIHLVLL